LILLLCRRRIFFELSSLKGTCRGETSEPLELFQPWW